MRSVEDFYKMFDLEISACGQTKQADFIKSLKADLKPCDVVSVRDLFSEEQVGRIKRMIAIKQCYRNAFKAAEYLSTPNEPVKYVEGRVLISDTLPIEHAWNKVGDKFFDVTFELVLGYDVTKEAYAAMAEYDVDYVRGILLEKGYWGEIYVDEKRKEFYGYKTKSERNTFQHQ